MEKQESSSESASWKFRIKFMEKQEWFRGRLITDEDEVRVE